MTRTTPELIARRMLDALSTPFELAASRSEYRQASASRSQAAASMYPDQLLRDADAAMYQVKRRGGANHQVIDLRELRLAEHRASLARDLPEALAARQLRAEYQPIVHTTDGRITGGEALLRWDHPVQGPIPPAIVIPIAEHARLIGQIGQWMLEKACADRHSWDGAQGSLEHRRQRVCEPTHGTAFRGHGGLRSHPHQHRPQGLSLSR